MGDPDSQLPKIPGWWVDGGSPTELENKERRAGGGAPPALRMPLSLIKPLPLLGFQPGALFSYFCVSSRPLSSPHTKHSQRMACALGSHRETHPASGQWNGHAKVVDLTSVGMRFP